MTVCVCVHAIITVVAACPVLVELSQCTPELPILTCEQHTCMHVRMLLLYSSGGCVLHCIGGVAALPHDTSVPLVL